MAVRCLERATQIVCVEPSTYNLWYLGKHLRWNNVNARILPYAIGDVDGTEVRCGGRGSSVSFRIGSGAEIAAMRTIPGLIHEYGLPQPTVLKIDIEGAEGAALNAARAIVAAEMAILVSVHSYANYASCLGTLLDNEFRVYESVDVDPYLTVRQGEWRADPDLIAVGRRRKFDPTAFPGFRPVRQPGLS